VLRRDFSQHGVSINERRIECDSLPRGVGINGRQLFAIGDPDLVSLDGPLQSFAGGAGILFRADLTPIS